MSDFKKPLTPVKPAGMEIIFLYPCPHCSREVPLISPSRPAMAQCDACRENFPIVPVDDRTMRYMKLVLAGGKAGIDPDFITTPFITHLIVRNRCKAVLFLSDFRVRNFLDFIYRNRIRLNF